MFELRTFFFPAQRKNKKKGVYTNWDSILGSAAQTRLVTNIQENHMKGLQSAAAWWEKPEDILLNFKLKQTKKNICPSKVT